MINNLLYVIPNSLEEIKSQIAEICRKYQISELRLFGSQVRGDFSEDSDFDFLVEFVPEAEIGFIELGNIKIELEEVVHKKVDLVPKAGLKKLIRRRILEEAEVVYAA